MPIETPPTPHWQNAQTAFVENVGQAPGDAKFVSLSMGYQLEITAQGARLNKTSFHFKGAQSTHPVGRKPAQAQFHYYAGKVKRTGVASFDQVLQPNLYPGIDAVYYGSQSALEYDIIVHPGGNPAQVQIQVDEAATQLPDGSIQIGGWRHKAPVAYQQIAGRRQPVPAKAILKGNNIQFEIGGYDPSQDLIIDPILSAIIDLEPRGLDEFSELAVAPDGSFAVAHSQIESAFASILKPLDRDIRVAKFSASGVLLFQTLIVGEKEDTVSKMAMDSTGAVFVVGASSSKDLPTSDDAVQTRRALAICGPGECIGGTFDAFALKLSPSGQNQWLTYLGSNKYDIAFGVAVHSSGRVYVTGFATGWSFPEKNEYQSCSNGFTDEGGAFLTVLNSAGNGLVYSTCLHHKFGSLTARHADAQSVAVDSAGNAYITGTVDSKRSPASFPVLGANGTNPFQGESLGDFEQFVAKFNPNLVGEASLIYSTLLGGEKKDFGASIVVDSLGQACITGLTDSINFPVRAPDGFPTPLNPHRGGADITVSCLNASGSALLFSNIYGGSEAERNPTIARDTAGNLWVGAQTRSTDILPVQPFENTGDGGALLLKLANNSRQVLLLSPSPFFINSIATVGNKVLTAGTNVATVIECAQANQFLQLTQGPIIFDLASGHFKQTINVAHIGPLLFTPPGNRLVFKDLPAGVQLVNAAGTTTCFEPGNPFLTLPLVPSQQQGGVNINVEFVATRGVNGVAYTPVFATGQVLP